MPRLAKKSAPTPVRHAVRLHWWIVRFIWAIMGVTLMLTLYERQWFNALIILAIMLLMALPARLGKQFRVHIPAEFELLALVFIFASLFLGEVRGYYDRFWWWDLALHVTSGLLLGTFGFLLVYVLNENRRIDMYLHPRFVALFAFLFAVTVGTLWEIFEWTMDEQFGLNMQKPTPNDPSGLTDTMQDLLVDTLGAAAISLLGWWHMHRGTQSIIAVWIHRFVQKNPRLFDRDVRRATPSSPVTAAAAADSAGTASDRSAPP